MSNIDTRVRTRPDGVVIPWPVVAGLFFMAVMIGVTLWVLGLDPFGSKVAPPPPPAHVGQQQPAPTVGNPPAARPEATAPYRESAVRPDRDPIESERIRINKVTRPSVVNVDTQAYSPFDDQNEIERTLGAGFFWDDAGRVVTNFHVVRDALGLDGERNVIIKPDRKIIVTLASGEAIPAKLVGIAPDIDLAVIQLVRVPEQGTPKIDIGASKDLEVGQTVYAIGSPYGQSGTFTHGIISALGRSMQSPTQHIIAGVIQTDAPLNPGNSGGPLLDGKGRVIGVNTAITSPTGGSVGLGYAIPIDAVSQAVTQLLRSDRAAQPYVGAEYELDEALVRRAGIAKGVLVRSVRPNSPAANAGLQLGDIILKVNNKPIAGLADLEQALNEVKVGDRLKLIIRRDKRNLDMVIEVQGI
jgi:S1-C subfamily serine protease